MICVVALIAVGPKKLPGMLHTLGQFIRKVRNMTNDVRNQTGIDELLRAEGLHGGLNELRGLLRVNHGLSFDAPHVPSATTVDPSVTSEPNVSALPPPYAPIDDPYAHIEIDSTREYPPEGADAYGALPDDLLPYEQSASAKPVEAPGPETANEASPEATPEATAETTTPSA